MNKAGRRTIKNLKGVDPRLVILVGMVLARDNVDFTITCGLRTLKKQKEAYKNGYSKLDGVKKKSKHQSGLAIDFIYYPFDNKWNVEKLKEIGKEFKICAKHLGFKCRYGGTDFGSFIDAPHFELY